MSRLLNRLCSLQHYTKPVNQSVVSVTCRMASQGNEQDNLLTNEKSRKFLQATHDVIVEDALVKGTDRDEKVINFLQPQQLKDTMDLAIEEEGASHERMLNVFRETIHYSVSTANPHYFNQLYNGRVTEGLAASWVVEALNTNVHTYECAPAFTIVEQYVVEKIVEKLGYKNGEGTFLPGGSTCNFTGIHLSRYNYDKTLKHRGLHNSPRMNIFSTSDAHYSVMKGAHSLGFGTESVVYVETDDRGRMIPEDLEKKITKSKEQGNIPLCVMATCGTTVLASFDPLEGVADVCSKYGVWLHVDACWGGCVIFSEKHKHLMKGIDRTDSVSISLHKMAGAQIQCAALLVNHKGLLRECNTTEASYLFQPDKHYDPYYDIGMMTLQCGRKADGYKFWALWKARGERGMENTICSFFKDAQTFTDKVKSRDEFRMVLPEFQYLNICFWYIPPSLRGQEETPEWWEKLAKVAPTIKRRMVEAGTTAIGYQPLESKGFVNFFRIILDNPAQKEEDFDFALDEIVRLGKDL